MTVEQRHILENQIVIMDALEILVSGRSRNMSNRLIRRSEETTKQITMHQSDVR